MSVSSLPKETDICSIKEHLQLQHRFDCEEICEGEWVRQCSGERNLKYLNSAALGTDDDSILRRRPLYGTRHGCVAAGRGLSRCATIKKEVSRPGSMAQTGECGRRRRNRRRSWSGYGSTVGYLHQDSRIKVSSVNHKKENLKSSFPESTRLHCVGTTKYQQLKWLSTTL